MADYKSLRVPEDAWKQAKEQKEAADRTWGEQIVRPDGESMRPNGYTNAELMDKLQQLESAQVTAGETTVDEKELGNALADYLVAEYELPRKVAAEVRER